MHQVRRRSCPELQAGALEQSGQLHPSPSPSHTICKRRPASEHGAAHPDSSLLLQEAQAQAASRPRMTPVTQAGAVGGGGQSAHRAREGGCPGRPGAGNTASGCGRSAARAGWTRSCGWGPARRCLAHARRLPERLKRAGGACALPGLCALPGSPEKHCPWPAPAHDDVVGDVVAGVCGLKVVQRVMGCWEGWRWGTAAEPVPVADTLVSLVLSGAEPQLTLVSSMNPGGAQSTGTALSRCTTSSVCTSCQSSAAADSVVRPGALASRCHFESDRAQCAGQRKLLFAAYMGPCWDGMAELTCRSTVKRSQHGQDGHGWLGSQRMEGEGCASTAGRGGWSDGKAWAAWLREIQGGTIAAGSSTQG